MQQVFNNRVALISGGMGDIGRAIAMEFARQGAGIALCDVEENEAAADFIIELQQYTASVSYQRADVTDADAMRQWVDEVEKTQGLADIIIVNAARVTRASLHEISPEDWSQELNVNLNGAFHLARSATKKLVENKRPGSVVFIGSWAAYTPHTHIPAYCVSKAGLRMLCKCMALELAPHNILVNELAPGYVAAGLTAKGWQENPGKAELAIQKVPVKKVMSAQQVAKQVIQLCHPDNEHITGSTILMDGGLSLLS